MDRIDVTPYVPAEGPRDARIVLVGEAPGATEARLRRPFVGKAGRMLDALLKDAGINRSDCYIMNLVKEQPPRNDIKYYFKAPGVPNERGKPHVEAFWQELSALKPHVIVPLGVYSTTLLLGEYFPMGRVRGHVEWSERTNCKVIPTWHPSAVDRQFNLSFLARFDLRKVAREAESPDAPYLHRLLSFPDTGDQAVWELERIADTASEVAFDFETDPSVAWPRPTMISFAPSPTQSTCVQLLADGKRAAYSPATALEVARLVERIMRDPDIRKVAQNAMFDLGVLASVFGVRVRGLWMDTMLAHACLYPSLAQGVTAQRVAGRAGKKDLEFLSGIYTNEPLHKKGRTDLRTMNAMDSAVTLEIAQALDVALSHEPSRYADYRRQAALIEPLLACTMQGVGWDADAQWTLHQELSIQEHQQLERVREAIGSVFMAAQYDPLDWVIQKLCKVAYKREVYGSLEFWEKLAQRRAQKPEGAVARGLVQAMQEKRAVNLCTEFLACINPASTQQMQHVLYTVAGLPKERKKTSNPNNPLHGSTTADDEALRKIIRRHIRAVNPTKRAAAELCSGLLGLRRISKALNTYASIEIGASGRFRCSYNVAGAYTGRLSSSQWFNQGTNGQNFPREGRSGVNVRRLLRADPGKVLLEFDLKQAEDRYVAWDAADPVAMGMYNDGLDVYSEIAAWVFQCDVTNVTKEQRYICKRAKLAYNYGIGPRTLAAAFAKDGFPHITEATCKSVLRRIATMFPGIERWKRSIERTLRNREHLVTPFGRRTRFMDRVDDGMFRQGYAFCPQSAIVELTNGVLVRIYDEVLPEEPSLDLLMQQHDGIITQAPLWDATRIIDRVLPLYDTTLALTGGTLRIPVEVQVGAHWGEMHEVGTYTHA